MISAPLDDAEEQQLSSIVRKTQSQNTAILIKSASSSPASPPHLRAIHGPHRFPVLASILTQCLDHTSCPDEDADGRRIVIAVQGRKDLDITAGMIKETFSHLDDGKLVKGLEGHADIVEFSKLWKDAFVNHRIILTSAQSLLYLFFHGLLRMDQISHLFFDDCTMANSNHPYCSIMKTFYLPVRAKLLASALESVSDVSSELDLINQHLPKIALFADWPLVSVQEDFITKRDRIAKMLQYLRLFQSVIRPLESDLKAPEDSEWLSYDELIYLKDAGCFEQLQTAFLGRDQEGLSNRLACVVDLITESNLMNGTANVLVLVKSENLQAAERLLPKLIKDKGLKLPVEVLSTTSMNTAQGSLLLFTTGDAELQLLAYYLQQQTAETLASVYLAEATLAPWLLLTLMAYAKQMSICSIRSQTQEALQDQAVEMALWMAAIGASSPVDSAPFRKLRAFVGGYEAVAKSAYLLADDSPIHHRIKETNAVISTAVSITMLLCCCSYLPHIGSNGTGLKINTLAVKRVSEDGKELDKERHFYMTRISLPPCLEPWIKDPAMMHVQGPLTPSRFSSQTLAANAALKLLHDVGVLDHHLMISEKVLSALFNSTEDAAIAGAHHQLEYNPFNDEDIDGTGAEASQNCELTPEAFQKGPEWKALEPQQSEDDPVDNAKEASMDNAPQAEDFFCYVFEYSMSLLDEAERYKPVGIKTGADENIILQEEDLLPADTLIHLCDESFMNTSNATRGFCLMTRRPIVLHMRPVELRIGATVMLRGTLSPISGQDGLVKLSSEQVNLLKRFQATTFGLITTKQYLISKPDSMELDGEEDVQMMSQQAPTAVPDDKQYLYFVALTIKADKAEEKFDICDLDATLDAYGRFIQSNGQRIGSQLTAGTSSDLDGQMDSIDSQSVKWQLDWEMMSKSVSQEVRMNLHEYLTKLEEYQAVHKGDLEALGPSPVFEYPNDPSREPLTIDFITFALRRLSLYAPYNGFFYRAKKLEEELTAGSPFESNSVPGCGTYEDYVRIKYGLRVKHPERKLIQVKRIEGFASLSKWLLTTSRSQSGKRRHRAGRHEQSKSDLIPELVQIVPLPYALIRMAILLPKAVHDIERQALIHDFYSSKLPSCLSNNVSLRLPASRVLVDSMTGPTASLSYDFERLEILGDSFLKLIASIDVFLNCPTINEGKLSSRRQDVICNATLYKIATSLDIYRYARLTPFFAKLWSPPDLIKQFDEDMIEEFPFIPFIFDEGQERWKLIWTADERAEKRSALYHLYPDGRLVDRGKEGERVVLAGALKHHRHKSTPSNTPVLSRFGHPIPPKAMADLVESIIGAVYKSGGYEAGIDLLRGFQIVSDAMLTHRSIDPNEALGFILGTEDKRVAVPKISSAIVTPAGQHKFTDIHPYVPNEENFPYEEIEAALGYKFRSRRLLFVAMTHSSVDVTYSNERLEWLGDAVLDWVITEYYYEQYKDEKWMTPARITSCRQAAVCNEAFSRVAVHCGLHKYLRIDSPFLQLEIDAYVKAVMAVEEGPEAADPEGPLTALSWNTRYNVSKVGSPVKTKTGEDGPTECPALSIPPAPKAIGDLFEGVAGAVYIDCGFDLQTFANVYSSLTRWYLDRHADPYDLPENPISDFWHDYMAAGVPPTAIEFRYCLPEEVQQRLTLGNVDGSRMMPEKASTATCQIVVRGRVVAEATAPNRVLARKFATRQAVIYIRSSGWRDFLS